VSVFFASLLLVFTSVLASVCFECSLAAFEQAEINAAVGDVPSTPTGDGSLRTLSAPYACNFRLEVDTRQFMNSELEFPLITMYLHISE
jgi:hypothetical protein